MKKEPLTIAITGKGGVGKTVITTLIAKVISKALMYKVLLIDADPTHPHLCNMVKLTPNKSLEEIRIDAVKKAHQKDEDPQKLAERIDFDVYEGMAESKDFCLFSIGQPEGPGCFCPSNTLLRKVIESISKDFDLILIDCEAGLEQINRMVLKTVDTILIVTDISLRSIETANSIRGSAKKFTKFKNLGVIINKVKGDIGTILNKLNEFDLPVLGQIPEDQNITKFDLEGQAIYDLSDDSECMVEIRSIVNKILND